MRTIRDFRNYIEKLAEKNSDDANRIQSLEWASFKQGLDDLGWVRKTKEVSECSDIDATAYISDREWENLEKAFRSLPTNLPY